MMPKSLLRGQSTGRHHRAAHAVLAVMLVVMAGSMAACGSDEETATTSPPATEAPATTESPATTTAADGTTAPTEAPDTTDAPDATEPTGTSEAETTAVPATDPPAASAYEVFLAGTNEQPPADGPKGATAKSVWVISCGQSAAGCVMFSAAQAEAAESLGWDVTIVDGAFSPTTEAQGIQQAVAAGADAVLLASIECDTVQAAVQGALDAGVAVIGAPDFGCGIDPSEGMDPLLSTTVVPSDAYPTFADLASAQGTARAAYLSETAPDAKIINVTYSGRFTMAMDRGFLAELDSSCTGCEIVATVELTPQDGPGGGFGGKIATALLENPAATAIVVPLDVVLLLGGAQALAQDGREMIVIGGEGSGAGMQFVRDGVVDAEVSVPWEWAGWAAVDSLNRWFNDAPAVPAGIGVQIVTLDNGLPEGEQPYQSEFDFRAAYQAAWGV